MESLGSILTGDKIEFAIVERLQVGLFRCLLHPNTEIVLQVDEKWDPHVASSSSATLLEFEASWANGVIHVTAKKDGSSCLLLHPSQNRGQVRIAEFFGGLAGWSYALHAFGVEPAVIIERDSKVASACAQAWQCDVIEPETFLERALSGDVKESVIVCGCVTNSLIWQGLGIMNVAHGMASPPCQPWSGAGSERGMRSDDGKVFSDLLKMAGRLQMMSLMAENVPAIVSHGDFPGMIAGALLDGMKMVVSGVYSCQRVLPLYRDRWLATFCHCTVTFDPETVQRAQAFSLASGSLCFPMPGPSLLASDSVHPASTSDLRNHLLLNDAALEMLKRSDLVPKWLASKINWSLDEPVLSARIVTPDMKMSGVMARYGSQHLLPIDLLLSKGLQTVVVKENGKIRFFCPWEILAALGFPSKVVIAADLTDAFQQVGNSISPIHAWIQLSKTHMLLGHLSMFSIDADVLAVLKRIREQCIRLSAFEPFVDGVFSKLKDVCFEDDLPLQVKRSRQSSEVEKDVSATIPFVAEVDCQAVCTAPMSENCVFAIEKFDGSLHGFCKGGLAFLKHHQHNWMVVVHGAVDEALDQLIGRALPHAKKTHFEHFQWMGREIQWHENVTCAPPATILFRPLVFKVECVLPDGRMIEMNGDVTWTIRTLMAFLAAKLKCNVDILKVDYNGIPTKACDFVTEFPMQTFQVSFQACLPGYVAFAAVDHKLQEKGMIPAHDGCVRFVAKHPAFKVIRTACVPVGSPIAAVVRILFPDLCGTITWTVHVQGTPCSVDQPVDKHTTFDVEWDCFKPLPPSAVSALCLLLPIDAAQMQVKHHASPQRWVKSPFRTKAQILRTDESITLMQMAASFVAHAQLDLNMTCHVDGILTDPSICLSQVSTQHVICFKVAPLLGGAKKADTIKARVVKVLEQHGVSKDACNDRAGSLLSKADFETIAKAESGTDDDFRAAMKTEANRVNFRLVFRNEMQQAKIDGRKKPPSKQARKTKTAGAHDDFIPNSTNVVIDIKHFKDGDDSIEMIETARFGPDQRGLAVMSLEEADRHPQGSSMSVDALAVLIVGRKFGAADAPFNMPAVTMRGEPVVIQAALRQFGDREVSFQPAVPCADVACAASTVVELHIYKSEVGSWKECSVPLHYLGVHISAVRGSSLISTWSMKTWKSTRQPSPFKEADYWHGFIRVPDDILDQVLCRSGYAGIYVSPKDGNRRHDDRFAVIAMPDCGLTEVQKKAAAQEKALGVVRLRDQFGIRCRREHSSSLRAILLPESAFVDTAGIKADETMWVLKNMPAEVGKDGLLDALQRAGWDAQPIRAQGQNRWLVAARDTPESKHFCINGSYVLVEPVKRHRDGNAVTITAKQVKVDTLVNATNGNVQIAASTRIQEVKAEISEQLEMKMQAANEKIAMLSSQLENFQIAQQREDEEARSELQQVRDEQAFARQKIGEVEQSVVHSGQTVIATMQQMMASLETNVKQWMSQSSVGDDGKRSRTDQPGRADSFATKS